MICRSVSELRTARRSLRAPVGFVPTMGALHAGHESLVQRACRESASSVVSIFVNPLQFGPNDDLARYPRQLEQDASLLERCGVDVLFAPAQSEMLSDDAQISVEPGELARYYEGASRPGHFHGVATIVLKLFNIVAPERAYFGRKDAQQLSIVRRMVRDLDLPLEIVDCPTVRERDGLALSSRNAYLSETERRDAVGLSRALRFIVEALERGSTDLGAVLRAASAELGALRADYLAVVDPNRFAPLERVPPGADLLAIGAAFCGATRLIDNMPLHTT